jgi:hypothetical protein
MGDLQSAQRLLLKLQKQPWSPVYYPDMPGYLNRFAAHLQEQR